MSIKSGFPASSQSFGEPCGEASSETRETARQGRKTEEGAESISREERGGMASPV